MGAYKRPFKADKAAKVAADNLVVAPVEKIRLEMRISAGARDQALKIFKSARELLDFEYVVATLDCAPGLLI